MLSQGVFAVVQIQVCHVCVCEGEFQHSSMAVQAAVLWRPWLRWIITAQPAASFDRRLRVLRHGDGPALNPSSSLHPGAQRPALRAVSYHHKEAECIKHGGHTDTGSPGRLSLHAETKRGVLRPVTLTRSLPSLSLFLSRSLLYLFFCSLLCIS